MSFNNRINNLKTELANAGLDGLYVTNLTNVRYLTGFTGSAGAVLILPESSYFLLIGVILINQKTKSKKL